MFWRKPGILIPDLYLYDIKYKPILCKIDKKKNTLENHKFFRKIFENFLIVFFFIYIYIYCILYNINVFMVALG